MSRGRAAGGAAGGMRRPALSGCGNRHVHACHGVVGTVFAFSSLSSTDPGRHLAVSPLRDCPLNTGLAVRARGLSDATCMYL